MSQPTNKLTAVALRNAKPREKTYRLADGGGLYLEVTPTGGTYWRMKYRFGEKEKRLAIGVYPEVSLAAAREARTGARQQLSQGVDPSTAKRLARAANSTASANTFEAIALEWWEKVHQHKVVPEHAQRNKRRLERDAFPSLGKLAARDITPPVLLATLRKIEERGHIETAHRVKTLVGQVIRYAINTHRADRDPTPDLRDSMQPAKNRHHAAITDPAEVPALIRAMHGYSGQPVTVAALKLAPLVFVRPGELRKAEWAAFDLDAAEWSFQPSKNAAPLIVPLPRQAVEILSDLHGLTGRGRYVFPGARDAQRPMSSSTIKGALDSIGYKKKMTAHGFRAMARTILAERLNYPPEYIEQQLAHAVKDSNGRAYNRTQHLDQRREMLQSWADYLDALVAGSTNIVPIKKQA